MTMSPELLHKISGADQVGLPVPVAEFKFHATRRWRFDYAWPDHKIAIEIEGGVWQYGRHNRAAGYIKDMEKYREAAALRWFVLRFTPSEIRDGKAIPLLKRIMQDS